jgi:hypothetical protein
LKAGSRIDISLLGTPLFNAYSTLPELEKQTILYHK